MKNPLPKIAREMIWGTMFGDGGVYYGTKNRHCKFAVSHSPKQEEYINWKHNLLESVKASKVYRVTKYHKIRKKEYTTLQFCTKPLSYFTRLRKLFYPQGKKIILRRLLNKLTPLGLAVWFMDDGTSCKNNRRYPQLNISTCSYTFEENKIIQEYFKEKWDIDVRVHRRKNFPHIYINKPNSLKLIRIIKYHLIPSMQYKIRFFVQPSPYPLSAVEDIV